ncbi:hypothetical protein TRFO_30090 [Tritrichomonas foetus]|uniref:VPS9 domain-containing protein n=1 Tax=Tritrichomonas foetus TaxID=1144522 RepID=A0A1J4JZP0_9EUKA|nr:hypothetical protein TRFO_30090 [Tritrichomonas foetus]|eukprot:OHT02725.1 hypothetical protein TRFO_30090 [Tritrichomonas foetus]
MQNEDSKECFEILLSYVKLFIEDLLRSIFHMPTLIRYFYKRVADIDDSGLLVEFLFFDYLVQPALMNPKLFALIPETASQGSGSYMTTLTRLFRWSLNPSSIPEKYKFIEELEVFQNLNVRQIINTLSNFDGKIKGVYATEFHTITEIRYHPLLLSVNDIAFLLRIINDTIDEIDIDPNEKKKIVQLCSFQSNLNLENDELIDFWFQSFKDPEVPKNSLIISNDESILLKLPIIRTPAVPTFDPKDLYVKTIYHLQGYLQMAHSNSKSPQTLIKYLEEQERRANQTNSIEWLTRTQAIKAKLERCERTENQILKSLFDIINYGLKESSSRLAVSFRHEEFTDEITNKLRDISNMIAQLSPNIHQSLLRLYLHRNKEIKIDVERNKLKLLAKPQEWIDFLTPMTQQIVAFGQSLKLDKSDCFRLTRQFHSEICSSLTFNMYRTANPQFESEDQSINRKIKRILKKFLKENYSKTLDQLFKTPSCFESAINTLKQGAAVGAPLEKLEQITSSMNIIQNIYLFESGERCPGDDLLPLFIYILLRSKLPYLVSLTNYIRHFLMSIEETVNVMDSKEKYVITTFLTATEHIIDEANKFKKKSKSSSKKLE